MDDSRRTRSFQLKRDDAPLGSSFAAAASDLNEQQLAAVCAPDGPVLVLAGAGSGKTRVITYRVAYLISERKVNPERIMLATFTNKAAREMLRRCEEAVGQAARSVTSGTFHHIANLLLRRYGNALGYDRSFTILDESDSRSVMKAARGASGVDTQTKAFPSDRVLVNILSTMVNTNSDLDNVILKRYPHLYDSRDDIQRVLIEYGANKKRSNQMDFDDLLLNLYFLLRKEEAIRTKLAGRYQHVLVDEYQDVNHLQASIVAELYRGVAPGRGDTTLRSQLTPDAEGDEAAVPPIEGFQQPPVAGQPDEAELLAGRGLFVVGDDAQSIYSFRGADYTNIRSFPDDFPRATVFKLETNYRSVPQVLKLANGILDEADPLFRKELRPVKPAAAERPVLLNCRDVSQQAEFIALQLLELREQLGYSWSDMAVLYRTHNNRLEVELELQQRGIPFIVRGGLRFFEQAHIKDLLSYLLVLANSRDELAWQRMLEMCRSVGPKTIAKVLKDLRDADEDAGGPLGKFIHNGVARHARGKGRDAVQELQAFLRGITDKLESLAVPDLIKLVIEQRYQHYIELKYDNWRQRLDDLEQLMIYAGRFSTLVAFLTEVGLNGSFSGSDLSGEDTPADYEEGAVTLSTIHQAKGLEWRAVFVIHVQDDVIPHRMSQGDSEQEAEEQRLLYVAVTRAEELLFLSYPQLTETRDFQRIINRPSRFLAHLPKECYDLGELED